MAASDQAPSMLVPTDDEMLQTQAELWRHTLSYLTSMTLRCAVHLGIPTAIHRHGGAASLPDLVTALSLPTAKLPFLRRLMRLLVHSGIFASDDAGTTYRLTPVSFFLVDGAAAAVPVVDGHLSQVPHVLASTSRHCLDTVAGLAGWFREDFPAPSPPSPFEHVHGVTPLESTARLGPEDAALFQEGLRVYDASGFAVVLRECRDVFDGVESLTDCGGGDGTAARAIAEAFPHVKCWTSPVWSATSRPTVLLSTWQVTCSTSSHRVKQVIDLFPHEFRGLHCWFTARAFLLMCK
ncbi:Os11g0303300 [Oryza sativa Japonica Group]|uniref:Os11g0303300 protein n=2 Tax=Oryza sativa subsp. japonica TaxID=39947 RepID=A0A5S6R785_ORYSJ|nr:Similar to herbicide safener binding protein 1 - maize [Oryza sativa Japonica Group]ABA92954.1 O-methyltransferase family protein [Oryza sativa Japonica Group]BAF28102.2 Os11g0303300 [Oryza sativa Japonica Group]|eukprot:NP_001067739.2 Os11g0303300 [Oryza sativa Japonica Group]